MAFVAVKIGVGDKVRDAVGLAVKVAPGVGESTTAIGKPARAVPVAPEIIVAMTAVPRMLRSCVGAGTPDTAHASESINKAVTDKRMGVGFRMVPPFGHQQRS